MTSSRPAVLALRAFLVLLFLLLVMLQLLSFPGQFEHMAREHPDDAHLRWPLTALAFVGIACVQVIIVSVWKLLGMVATDRIFSDRSMVWVDAILYAIAFDWLLFLGLYLWVASQADDPGIVVLMTAFLLAGGAFGLLMVVMRALLRQATTLRADMEAVI